MIELLTQHLDTLIAFITGGGLLTVLTIRSTKKKAEADAMKMMQDLYQEMIKDLRGDKEEMRKENDEMREKIKELRAKVDEIKIELVSIRRFKCVVMNCKDRKTE